MEADARLRARYPQLGTLETFENWLAPRVRAMQRAGTGRSISTIPIIFHIVHNGEAVGNGDNISAAYVDAQIQQLNNDFRRITGTSGYNAVPVGADAEIEFCPAATDPNGNFLSEPGINRIDRRTMGWSEPPYGVCIGENEHLDDTYIEETIKPQSQWDPNQYLNVWVLEINCGVLGYAQFPSTSGLSGLGSVGGPAVTDGVVLLTTSIGSTELPFPGGEPYNKGRTGTHEIGHFFGLRHIWGDDACGNDYCADTPEAEGPARGCPEVTTCDGVRDMVENYMDYTYDDCMNLFTADQKARMQTVLQNSSRRGVLANSSACTSGNGNGPDCVTIISNYPYTEGFESGSGAWTQSQLDDFDWSRHSGATSSTNTGPGSAAAGSWYLYLEASAPNNPGKLSMLNSPCFDLGGASSAGLDFQYHLFGASDMGNLLLEVQPEGGEWTALWSQEGNQGDSWHTASVDLNAYLDKIIRLRFLGTTGATWEGDIAIDEIKMSVETGGPTPPTACESGLTAFPYNEDWETGFGGWSQDDSDDFDWLRNSGPTASSFTGPTEAFSGNWYAYLESSEPNYSHLSAVLNGPCIDLTAKSQATFTFQYYMYGATNMGGLTLEVRPGGGNWSTIWAQSGNQGDSWLEAAIDLSAYAGNTLELRFIGTTGTTWQGDIAIDALQLTTGDSDPGSGSCTDIVLSITFDNYPEETSWEITDAAGNVAYSGGPYNGQTSGSTLNLTGCIADGCYTFTIFDRYGDGMCCSFGSGSYTFKDTKGKVLASGGAFGSSEATNFCLPTATRQFSISGKRRKTARETLTAFPNPVRDLLMVAYETEQAERVNYRIVDLLGKTIQSATWQVEAGANYKELAVIDLPAGTYLLAVDHGGQQQLTRFVVSR